jgi:serine protease Do
MERVVIKHLSGSKANQAVGFPLDQMQVISLGRDAASTVAYDMDRDDAVSRNHATITRDPAQSTVFILTDLGSRNGVFVNHSRITGSTALHHGDIVQLGTGGPEFSFEIDPPPAPTPKATRQIDLRQATPTREISLGNEASAEVRPQRMVLRHKTGSKANQEVSFPVTPTIEITFGRDPAASVSYDAERDDTVSRNHATIRRDAQQKGFALFDLNSRNGVFVNGARIRDSATLHQGDLIQFGTGGPEISFQLDPPPADALRATRQFDARETPPAQTREAAIAPAAASPASTGTAGGTSFTEAPRGVGKETVERLITETKVESRKSMVNIVAGLVALVAVVAGAFMFMGRATDKKIETTTAQVQAAKTHSESTASAVKAIQDRMEPQEIAKEYSESTVYIEVDWKLIDLASGQQLRHRYVNNAPAYVEVPKEWIPKGERLGKLEPWLTFDESDSKAIGGRLAGSGFAVTDNGFILTNQHVAAPWKEIKLEAGIVVTINKKGEPVIARKVLEQRWSPAQSVYWLPSGGNSARKDVSGRHDRLEVTFAHTKLRFQGKLVRVSDEHDVALIKVDAPAKIKPAPLAPLGSEREVQPGNPITILSYPDISLKTLFAAKSKDMLDQGTTIAEIPVPTVTPSAISKVVSSTTTAGEKSSEVYSEKNTYQLTANISAGSSGGPVFDDRGRVIGIFYAGNRDMTLAVPIRFARELMDVKGILH